MGNAASAPEPVQPPPEREPLPPKEPDTPEKRADLPEHPDFLPTLLRDDIKITSKGFFDERQATNIPLHKTFTLPKGTMLFRAIKELSQKEDDFRGLKLKSNPTRTCLRPNYQVFFYPYPYVISTMEHPIPFTHTVVYVTTRDIEIVCLVNPSNYTRDSRVNIVRDCFDINDYKCESDGRSYDACLTKDYRIAFPDVTGMIAIAESDAEYHHKFKALGPTKPYVKFMGTQVGFVSDNRLTQEEGHQVEGVPEIVLHPFSRHLKEQFVSKVGPIKDFIEKHKDHLNYEEFVTLPRAPGDDSSTVEFMSKITSPEGYNGYHAAVDVQTGFFRIKELSAPFKSSNRVVRKDDPDFKFKRTPEFTMKFGGGRRKTRKNKRTRSRVPRM